MKLGVSYSAFEGINDLLEQSIRSIRDNVDFINVMYQEYGWRQDKILPEDLEKLHWLLSEHLIDDLVPYTVREFPSFGNKVLQVYERHKRLLGMNRVQQIGRCTHMLFIDSDEYYRPDQFKTAKEFIQLNSIERSFVTYHTMMNKPIYKVDLPTRWTSFITRCDIIVDDRRYSTCYIPGIDVDVTRIYHFNSKNDYAFPSDRLAMYHMQGVRKDLYKKFYSNTGSQFKFLDEIIKNIRNVKEPDPKYQGQFLFGNGVDPITIGVEIIPDYFKIPELEEKDSIPYTETNITCPNCWGKSIVTCATCNGTKIVKKKFYKYPTW